MSKDKGGIFMLSGDFQSRLGRWRNEQSFEEVELDKIDIAYKIHKDANGIGLYGKLGKMKSNKQSGIVVMKKSNGRYTLLFGMSDLIVLKLLNYKEANVIVTDLNRNEVEKELIKY